MNEIMICIKLTNGISDGKQDLNYTQANRVKILFFFHFLDKVTLFDTKHDCLGIISLIDFY